MKTNRNTLVLKIVLLGFIFVLSMPSTQSQVIRKPEKKNIKNYPVQNTVLKPDIVLSDFNINWSEGRLQGMYYSAPFTVKVRNAGLLKTAVPFNVALQYSIPSDPDFHGENTGDNCFQVPVLLASNQLYLLAGTLKTLSTNMAGNTIKFRAIGDVDCLSEFPAPNGKIDESQESNNYSNEVSYTSGYLPNLDNVSPNICIKEITQCVLSGTSLGPQDDKYALVIEQDGYKTVVAAASWATVYIKFKIPASVKTGKNMIYIADKTTLDKVSDAVEFTVGELNQVPWTDILGPFDLASTLFSLRLHNWNGSPEPENHSELKYPVYTVMPDGKKVLDIGSRVIEIPKVELNNWAGHYRFMFNDMMSASSLGFVFSRKDCFAKQFRLNIYFESEGKEIIGYYKVKVASSPWRREGAPDIHIDNGNLDNLFTLYYYNGTLNYNETTSFTAEVKAANDIEDAFLDYFKASWNDDIRAQIAFEMQKALNSSEMKSMITGMLMEAIQKKIPAGRTICKIEFADNAMLITSY